MMPTPNSNAQNIQSLDALTQAAELARHLPSPLPSLGQKNAPPNPKFLPRESLHINTKGLHTKNINKT